MVKREPGGGPLIGGYPRVRRTELCPKSDGGGGEGNEVGVESHLD
jgi:hypothetical protein